MAVSYLPRVGRVAFPLALDEDDLANGTDGGRCKRPSISIFVSAQTAERSRFRQTMRRGIADSARQRRRVADRTDGQRPVVSLGQISLLPGTTFDSLGVGESVTLRLPYSLEDGDGDTATNEIVITVNGENDAPEVTAATLSGAIIEDGTSRCDLWGRRRGGRACTGNRERL